MERDLRYTNYRETVLKLSSFREPGVLGLSDSWSVEHMVGGMAGRSDTWSVG